MKGTRTLTVLVACFVLSSMESRAANLVSVEPESAVPGVQVEVVITGEFEYAFTLPASVSFDPGSTITHGEVFLDDMDKLRTTLTIPSDTEGVHCGFQDVYVETQNYDYRGLQLFEVDCSGSVEPAIVQITPDDIFAGADLSVTVTGENTNFQDGTSELSFSNSAISVLNSEVISPTVLNADITADTQAATGTCNVTVTTGQEVAVGEDLFSVLAPLVTLSPDSGVQGSLLGNIDVLDGPGAYTQSTNVDLGEGITIGDMEILDNGDTLSLLNVDIAVNSPVGPHTLTMAGPMLQAENIFTVVQGPDTQLLSIAPNHGDRGHPALAVSLVGQNTHFDDEDVTLSFSAANISSSSLEGLDPTHLDATVRVGLLAAEGVCDTTVELGLEAGCSNCEKVTLADSFEVTTPGTIDNADPSELDAAATVDVSIAATDGQFADGETYLVLTPDDGVVISGVSVTDADHLTATFEVAADASGEPRTLRTVTGTEVAVGEDIIDIQNPAIVSIVPSSGLAGTDIAVVISGQDIVFDSDTQVSFSGDGIDVTNLTVNPGEAEKITAQISIAIDATIGSRDVTVTAQGLELTLEQGFLVDTLSTKPEAGGCSCSTRGSRGKVFFLLAGLFFLLLSRRRN